MPNDSIGPENPDDSQTDNKPVWKPFLVIAAFALVGLGIIWALCLNYIPLEKDRVSNFLVAAVSYLILMAMFVQAYITQRQWGVMRESARQTRELFDLVERPIVVVEAASGGDIPNSQNVMPSITLTNKGRMAAKDILVIFEAQVGLHAVYPPHTRTGLDVDFLATADEINIVAPPASPAFIMLELDEQTHNAVVNGDLPLFIYGKGRYYDLGHRNRHEIAPFVFVYSCNTQTFIRNYTLPYAWLVEENLRKPAPWRPERKDEEQKNPN